MCFTCKMISHGKIHVVVWFFVCLFISFRVHVSCKNTETNTQAHTYTRNRNSVFFVNSYGCLTRFFRSFFSRFQYIWIAGPEKYTPKIMIFRVYRRFDLFATKSQMLDVGCTLGGLLDFNRSNRLAVKSKCFHTRTEQNENIHTHNDGRTGGRLAHIQQSINI